MVLEGILKPHVAEERWWMVFLLSVGICIAAIILTLYFPLPKTNEALGYIMILLITMITVPFLIDVFRAEAWEASQGWTVRGKNILSEDVNIIERNMDVVLIHGLLFLGCIFTLSAAYMFLPSDTSHNLFMQQEKEVDRINYISSGIQEGTGMAMSKEEIMPFILANNIKVLIFSFVLSLAFGTGAIYILTWNASVIAVWIGESARVMVSDYSIFAWPIAFITGTLSIFPHGFFEFFSYFLGAVAGGMLSVAILRYRGKAFVYIIKDAALLFVFALVCVTIGAVIESMCF